MNTTEEEIITKITYAHQEWLCALDAVSYPIFLHDKDFRILRCNKAYSHYAGIPYSEIIGRLYYELFPKNDGPLPHCTKALEDPLSEGSEEDVNIGDKLFHSKGFIIKDEQGNYLYSLHILEDITDQRRIEEALRTSEEKFRSLVESTSDWIWEIDQNGNYTYASPMVESLLGYTPEEVVGKSPFDFIVPEDVERLKGEFQKLIDKHTPLFRLENTNMCKDGTVKILETSGLPYFDKNGAFAGYRGIDRDITERKQSEVSLNQANRALKTLSAGNIALVRANDENELLQTITNIIIKQAGYSLAAVVYADENPQKSIRLASAAGMDLNHYWAEDITWDDTEKGQLPVCEAIRSGTTQICHNIACAIGFKGWKESTLAKGYTANIALPLKKSSQTFGALCIYSSEKKAFQEEEEIRLLEELANDLAYGIMNLRTRVEQEQHATLLRQSLEQSIQTIAATVEARDPYTAGHQHRVSELATAIALEMNLSDEQIQGIHLASIIHDLGKIHIPAEILSKPGKLNNIEFMLIQTHPEEGYNILKDVKFPWPIADIIWQHHEKLDGSGYPQGLTGDKILLEAKIICVADVVEAMSSHRPYRASLGIKPALYEIKRGRGSWYDPSVVDACLKLFDEKRFKFSTLHS